jgi:hypothetical protein
MKNKSRVARQLKRVRVLVSKESNKTKQSRNCVTVADHGEAKDFECGSRKY